ncbi:ImmA/IrrE family metallo-endopeptidase [Robertkochia sediminum]|uniref:ImmA/IrrE family metallo-endopeptidase n=1 Tax=Robertkochia sediminum TaxID=2785326 RepID=UPI0019315A14|nr:ImmA/IrrE family metallo-endopeptidase [Robertkochia sediminum]MBL7472224.1 ImmA/IrrE family metallo-endopeptidase [Robertkochia sediminum]
MKNNPRKLALKILAEFGIDDPKDVSIEDIIYALNIPLKYSNLTNCDGRIIHNSGKSLIVVNENIKFDTRRNFTLAHELGHYLMHRNELIQHVDDSASLAWYDTQNRTKISQQEIEANTFAAEILLPSHLFKKEVFKQPFDPSLIRDISDKYNVSRSSVIYRFLELGNHPICVFYTKDNKVSYWRRSNDFNFKIKDCTRIPPPDDSVAAEFFDSATIYTTTESKQEISKSTWLEVKEDYADDIFYEYCLVHSESNLAISVIWED